MLFGHALPAGLVILSGEWFLGRNNLSCASARNWRLLPLQSIFFSDQATLDAFPSRASREGREHLSQQAVELRRCLGSTFFELEPQHLSILVQLLSREILRH